MLTDLQKRDLRDWYEFHSLPAGRVHPYTKPRLTGRERALCDAQRPIFGAWAPWTRGLAGRKLRELDR